MRWMWMASATTFLAFTLACGGGGEGGMSLGGPSVGEYAQLTADQFAAEHPDIGAPTYNVGDEFVVGDFTLRLDEAVKYIGETDREHVVRAESDVMSQEGVKALVFVYSIKNNTALAKAKNLNMNCITTDGEKSKFYVHHERLLWKTSELEDLPAKLPPGEWVQTGIVCSGKETAMDGAVWRVYYKTREYDPTDPRGRRKMDVYHAQAIVDIGSPRDGGHFHPDKR
ncbi:MAG: hypothetical protein EP330_11420 [Deltaproteobacteria bacterium]|nr:MAG: hypothetical protein EP330_11420 [Deltaproteobacteria bacterium]